MFWGCFGYNCGKKLTVLGCLVCEKRLGGNEVIAFLCCWLFCIVKKLEGKSNFMSLIYKVIGIEVGNLTWENFSQLKNFLYICFLKSGLTLELCDMLVDDRMEEKKRNGISGLCLFLCVCFAAIWVQVQPIQIVGELG